MKKEKRITAINITMMHPTSGRSGGFSPVPPSPRTPSPQPQPVPAPYHEPGPTMLHLTSGRNGFDSLPVPLSVMKDSKELLVEKYKGKFDRWLKNVPNGIEDDIKKYIRTQME